MGSCVVPAPVGAEVPGPVALVQAKPTASITTATNNIRNIGRDNQVNMNATAGRFNVLDQHLQIPQNVPDIGGPLAAGVRFLRQTRYPR